DVADGVEHERLVDLLTVHAGGDEVVPADLLVGVHLEAVELTDTCDLERADVDVAHPVAFGIEKRVGDGDGDLVTKLWRADGVAVDEDVGHGLILVTRSARAAERV